MVRIVIVDPHASSRESLAALLNSRKDFAVVGQSGSGVETGCFESNPDLVVLELDLSECNGLELLKWVRKNLPSTRVLIHCGSFDRLLLSQALALKPDGLVHKTESLETFILALKAVAQGQTYISPVAAAAGSLDLGQGEALTTRELEVVKNVTQGKSSRDIAKELGISLRTVEKHRANAMQKLEIKDVVTLTHYAFRNGLVGFSRAAGSPLRVEVE